MSALTRPRGPLPPRVYWTRRLLVLGLALALVFGVSRLLGGTAAVSENPSARPAAAPVGSPTTGQTPQATATGEPTPDRAGDQKPKKRKPAKVRTPLAVPTGPCADSDITVTPSVEGTAFAGQDVVITLNLTTVTSPACTWEVSPGSVVLRLTSGSDRIWSTQDCPAAVGRQQVVVRNDHVSTVQVTWSGQRSDDECTRTTAWAQPGWYHATAAALGAEPQDLQFRLKAPTAPTITATPKPDRDKKKAQEKRDQDQT